MLRIRSPRIHRCGLARSTPRVYSNASRASMMQWSGIPIRQYVVSQCRTTTCSHSRRFSTNPLPQSGSGSQSQYDIGLSSPARDSFEDSLSRMRKGMVSFLILAAVALYLGVWQLNRKKWKEQIISERVEAMSHDSKDFHEMLAKAMQTSTGSPETIDLQRVIFEGIPDYPNQFLVGPRAYPHSNGHHGIGAQSTGYYIYTPFIVDGATVLVNRGWVPYKLGREINPENSIAPGPIRLVGITSKGEKKPPYIGNYDPVEYGSWIWLDLPRVSEHLKLQISNPWVIELLEDKTVTPPANVERKSAEEFVEMRITPTTHASYAFTWLSLSAISVGYAAMLWKKRAAMKARMAPPRQSR